MDITEPSLMIRADGGAIIGMGHLMRTSVIAEKLKEYINVSYVCNQKYKEGIRWLEQKGYKVYRFEEEEILEKMIKIPAYGVLTDNYMIDDEYIKKIKSTFKVVGYIDDNVLKDYKADFIINQNFGAEELKYKTHKGVYMLGGRYLLVRKNFRQAIPIKINESVKNILLTVGGSDSDNFTEKILEWVKDLPYKFNVIIGPMFPYEKSLKKKFKQYKNIVFYNQPEMKEFMIQNDMAISSCGSTLYELGILGIPTVGISVADNQEGLARRMYNKKMIEYVGGIKEIQPEILRKKILELDKDEKKRERMSNLGINELNKDGVELVVKKIMEKIEEVKINDSNKGW